MKMKKILAVLAASMAMAATASAEQPEAQTYRDLLQNDDYCIRYQLDGRTKYLVAKRGEQACLGQSVMVHNKAKGGGSSLFGAVIAIATAMSQREEWMTLAYKDEKGYYRRFFGRIEDGAPKAVYYRFLPKERAGDPALDPEEHWGWVTQDAFRYSDALDVLDWKQNQAPSLTEPVFSTTMQKTIDKESYTCDRYLSSVKTAAGTEDGQVAYDLLYQDGTLKRAQQSYIDAAKKEKVLADVKIISIDRAKDADFKVIEKGKIYKAGTGDLDDMIDSLKELGEVGTEKWN